MANGVMAPNKRNCSFISNIYFFQKDLFGLDRLGFLSLSIIDTLDQILHCW